VKQNRRQLNALGLTQLWHNLSELGVRSEDSLERVKRFRLVNRVALIVVLLASSHIFTYAAAGVKMAIGVQILSVLGVATTWLWTGAAQLRTAEFWLLVIEIGRAHV
jgi:hypothetical protein